MIKNKSWLKLMFKIFLVVIIVAIISLICTTCIDKYTIKSNYIGPNREKVDSKMRAIAKEIKGNNRTPIYILDNFLSVKECDTIIASVVDGLEPSTLTRPDKSDPYFRTSKTGHFDGSGIQDKVETKIARMLDLPRSTSETCQVQHYEVGDEFKAHWDYFHEGVDDDFLKDGQRTWTFMVYLNNVKKGGSTEFVNLGQKIYPKKGTAVVWCSLDKDAKPDEDTLHRGSPVEDGHKFIITKWFLDKK